MTAAQVNAIVDDIFEMAVTNNKSNGTLNITGNAAPTGDSLLAYNALEGMGWNVGAPIMAWHKFATVKTDGDGTFEVSIALYCETSQGVNYEVHEIAETKPDTIAAINSGSSLFTNGYEHIIPTIIKQAADTEYDLWLDLDAQIYTTLDISLVDERQIVPSINLSNDVLDVATYSLDNIGLETLTGIDGLTNLNSPNQLTGNALTAAAQDDIIAKVWDNAISTGSTGKTFDIRNNDGVPSLDNQDKMVALKEIGGWTINGVKASTTVISNIYELQAINLNKSGSFELINDIDASGTSTWNYTGIGTIYNGFVPIGTTFARFTGLLNGNGYTISNLYMKRAGNVGMFFCNR